MRLRDLRTEACRTALLLVVAQALHGCAREEAHEPHVRPVKVRSVASRLHDAGLRYSASLHPHREIQLAFKQTGYVTSIHQVRGADGRMRDLQQGDPVRTGTVLAILGDGDQQERVDQARAQHAEAAAGLVRAQADMGRAERLYAAKSLTRPEYDAAVAGQAAAQARTDAALAQLRAAEVSLRDCSLTSPLDGVVLSARVEVGTLASPGTVGFVVADVEQLEAVFGVPAHEMAHLELGDSLPVSIEGHPPFEARITALAPSADSESRVFAVEVAVPNPDDRFRTGMIATVLVPRAQHGSDVPAPLTVPLAAVVRASHGGDAYAVFVVDGTELDGIARERAVQLGPITGNEVTVETGLAPGDRVVVTGATLVEDGAAVRIIP